MNLLRLRALPVLPALLLSAPLPAQSLDGFEDLQNEGVLVTQRVVDGVGVTLSTGSGRPITARRYGGSPPAFPGLGGQVNQPQRPAFVTGEWFVSSSTNQIDDFSVDAPIEFLLDAPVHEFGITTLDLLEGAAGATDRITLRAFDENDDLLASHSRVGPQDVSGLDLYWRVRSLSGGIRRVTLSADLVTGAAAFGLDDLFVRATPLPPAVRIEVAQESAPGAGDFNANVLGEVGTLDFTLDPTEAYGYREFGVSHEGPFDKTDRRSHVWIGRSLSTDQLTLVVVHDDTGDVEGGSAETRVRLRGDANGGRYLVQDDPGPTSADSYVGDPGAMLFEARQQWIEPNTDGYAIGDLEGPWSVLLEFLVPPTGLDTWAAISGDGAPVDLALEPGRRVRLRPVDPNPTVGRRFCFGDGTGTPCPCANSTVAGEGCRNSTGRGAVLSGLGSSSVSADDLVLSVTQLPPNKNGLFFLSASDLELPFGDGLRCAGGAGLPSLRFRPPVNSGAAGSFSAGPGLAAYSQANFPAGAQLLAGTSWNFQAWYRDPMGACAAGFNTTNALAVTFGP